MSAAERTAFVVVAMLASAGPARAQDATLQAAVDPDLPPFEEIVENAQVPACPADLQATVADCTIAVTFTKAAGYKLCYCDKYAVTVYERLPIPEGERNLTRLSEISIVKITQGKPDSGTDPCEIMTIGGKRTKVCW